MPINRERLIKRRDELKNQMEVTRQNFIALQGAIADLDFLLSEKDEESSVETKEE